MCLHREVHRFGLLRSTIFSPPFCLRSHPALQAEADRATKSSWSKRLGHELTDARAKQQEVRRCRDAGAGRWVVSADPARLGKFKSSKLMNYVKHVDAWIS